MSVFTQFDTNFGDGFYSSGDHDGGIVGSELIYEHGEAFIMVCPLLMVVLIFITMGS